jgi:hypothetical protein
MGRDVNGNLVSEMELIGFHSIHSAGHYSTPVPAARVIQVDLDCQQKPCPQCGSNLVLQGKISIDGFQPVWPLSGVANS